MFLFFSQIGPLQGADPLMSGAKIGNRGSSSSKNSIFRPEGYSKKLNTYLEACWKKCCYFWFHPEVFIFFYAFLTSFWT